MQQTTEDQKKKNSTKVKRSAFFYSIFQFALFLFTRLTLKVKRKVLDKSIFSGNYVFCFNHPTIYDPFFLLTFSAISPMSVLIDEHAWNLPVPRLIFKLSGMTRLRRGAEGFRQTLSEASEFLKMGLNVAISPEGGNVPKGETVRARRSVIRLALENKKNIVPVGFYIRPECVKSTNIVLNNRKEGVRWVDNHDAPRLGAHYYMVLGKPIDISAYYEDFDNKTLSFEKAQELAEIVLEKVYECSDQARDMVVESGKMEYPLKSFYRRKKGHFK